MYSPKSLFRLMMVCATGITFWCFSSTMMLSVTMATEPQSQAHQNKAATQGTKASQGKSSDILVTVNGKKLTRGEVDEELNAQLNAFKQQVPPEQMEKVEAQIAQMMDKMRDQKVNEFIEKTVLMQEADKKKIKVDDNETNAIIKNYESQIPEGTTLESVLLMQGMTMQKLRDEISFRLRAQKLIDSQVKDPAAPNEDALREYYTKNKERFVEPESVHARHILVKTDPSDNETVKKQKQNKIASIRKRLLSGGDFAKIAQESSDCPSKTKGGDLGTFTRGRMIKEFEDAAFNQKVNEIGPVVDTKFGHHIIQVLEHKPETTKSFEEVKDQIRSTLQQQARNKAIKEYIDGLKQQATIVYATK
ncbi:MAG: peptidylprolyl isomerase [Desulfobacterota bacterium]|nr:peptidylprolyl isomerase [Thermodesulfobacteriota bacterium]